MSLFTTKLAIFAFLFGITFAFLTMFIKTSTDDSDRAYYKVNLQKFFDLPLDEIDHDGFELIYNEIAQPDRLDFSRMCIDFLMDEECPHRFRRLFSVTLTMAQNHQELRIEYEALVARLNEVNESMEEVRRKWAIVEMEVGWGFSVSSYVE